MSYVIECYANPQNASICDRIEKRVEFVTDKVTNINENYQLYKIINGKKHPNRMTLCSQVRFFFTFSLSKHQLWNSYVVHSWRVSCIFHKIFISISLLCCVTHHKFNSLPPSAFHFRFSYDGREISCLFSSGGSVSKMSQSAKTAFRTDDLRN